MTSFCMERIAFLSSIAASVGVGTATDFVAMVVVAVGGVGSSILFTIAVIFVWNDFLKVCFFKRSRQWQSNDGLRARILLRYPSFFFSLSLLSLIVRLDSSFANATPQYPLFRIVSRINRTNGFLSIFPEIDKQLSSRSISSGGLAAVDLEAVFITVSALESTTVKGAALASMVVLAVGSSSSFSFSPSILCRTTSIKTQTKSSKEVGCAYGDFNTLITVCKNLCMV
mmetsp:Transcript_21997/g.22319  ORF Transcript_21997/g.22319 Transcript_21997/m.22319 type:complete len:227 (-) Transcript_21997:228-908(-)